MILLLAAVLALASADAATVGAAAIQLRDDLDISNTDIGLLVTVTSLVAAAASLPFGVLADRVRRIPMLAGAIVLWGGAMLWTATAPTFGRLLLARVLLGGVTAAAGPIVASLVGDWFAPSERGRIYGYIISGELVGAAIGFAVTGGVATLSWRAAFVILALPAFVLAWLVFQLREPVRGRPERAPSGGTSTHRPLGAGRGRAQHHRRPAPGVERGIEPDPALVLRRDPREMNLLAATRYVLSIKTNVALIIASACGYYFLAGVQTFGVEFVTKQYGIAQVVSTLVLLVVGAAGVVGVLAGGATRRFPPAPRLPQRANPRERGLRDDRGDPLHSGGLHAQSVDSASLHLARGSRPLRAKPAPGCSPARHRPRAPLGPRGRRADLLANVGAGLRPAPLRRRFRPRLRRRRESNPRHQPRNLGAMSEPGNRTWPLRTQARLEVARVFDPDFREGIRVAVADA